VIVAVGPPPAAHPHRLVLPTSSPVLLPRTVICHRRQHEPRQRKAARRLPCRRGERAIDLGPGFLGAAQILEQAAKECGDAFTNTRIHSGRGGGPMQHEVKLTDRQRAEAIVDLLERVAIAGESGSGKEADAKAVADLFERVVSGRGGEVGG
jgi:DNA-binding NtrC family response regulator